MLWLSTGPCPANVDIIPPSSVSHADGVSGSLTTSLCAIEPRRDKGSLCGGLGSICSRPFCYNNTPTDPQLWVCAAVLKAQPNLKEDTPYALF